MRVITGTARGRKLGELEGSETRPTTDKVKEALFSIIQFDVEGRRVLDLFAGTGQLGIEALSRGAAHCTFVDVRREAVRLIDANLKLTGLAQDADVRQLDFSAFLTGTREKYDLVFLDPPYNSPFLEKSLDLLTGIDIVSGNGIIICESAADKVLPELAPPYEKGREYRYGKVKLTVYHRAL